LAKKSATSNANWEDVSNNNNDESVAQHRSTIGSISAAKAVLSIQQPIGPPPAHQSSLLAASRLSPVNSSTAKLVEQNNNRGTQTSAWNPVNHPANPAAVGGGINSKSTVTRPPRRKKIRPLNFSLIPENLSKRAHPSTAVLDSPPGSGLTIVQHGSSNGKFYKKIAAM
jgi:hypothetical protein